MDMDTLIVYILIFFFAVSSILKRRKKKKVQGTEAAPKKGQGLWSLGQAIQRFVAELEKEARKAREASENARVDRADPSIWELLDGRGPLPDQSGDQPESGAVLAETKAPPAPDPGRQAPRVHGRQTQPKSTPGPAAKPVEAFLPRGGLQQAVVWSEILGPPKALRQDGPIWPGNPISR